MRFSELDGARIGVWGAGREVASFAAQLASRMPSASIVAAAFDEAPPADVREILHAPAARVAWGADAPAAFAGCEVVVRSPGVSIHRPELRALREAGIPVATATGLWLAERGGERVIGVSGTKGKSTTAALAAHLLAASGEPVRLAGNIGVPALELLDTDEDVAVVLELSSYQIADLEVGPEVAVLTNLYREHLDWHGSEEAYRAEKLRLLDLPGVRVRVLGAAEAALCEDNAPREVRLFGTAEGWDVAEGAVTLRGRRVLVGAELPLLGRHNALNLCAALTALEAFGATVPPLPASLAGFQPLPHRLQTVAEREGVLWVNDSISTTPESALAAMSSFPGRELVLIAGGQDRGQEHDALVREIVRRRATVVGVPSTGARLIADARDAGVPAERAHTAPDLVGAVALARSLAGPGAVVLLSPAAPSYDHYRDFEERGALFAQLVVG